MPLTFFLLSSFILIACRMAEANARCRQEGVAIRRCVCQVGHLVPVCDLGTHTGGGHGVTGGRHPPIIASSTSSYVDAATRYLMYPTYICFLHPSPPVTDAGGRHPTGTMGSKGAELPAKSTGHFGWALMRTHCSSRGCHNT